MTLMALIINTDETHAQCGTGLFFDILRKSPSFRKVGREAVKRSSSSQAVRHELRGLRQDWESSVGGTDRNQIIPIPSRLPVLKHNSLSIHQRKTCPRYGPSSQ